MAPNMEPRTVMIVAAVAVAVVVGIWAMREGFVQAGSPAWDAARVRTYVISVPGTRPRGPVMARMSGKVPGVQFFDGVNGSSLKQQGRLKPGEMGCAASHMRLWEHIQEADVPTLILEDDAKPVDDFPRQFTDLMQHVGEHVDIVFVGHCLEERGKRYAPGLAASVSPRCTHGYLVTPRGARKLAQWARSHTLTRAIDEEIADLVRSKYLTALSSWPALVRTTDDASMIQSMGGRWYA